MRGISYTMISAILDIDGIAVYIYKLLDNHKPNASISI